MCPSCLGAAAAPKRTSTAPHERRSGLSRSALLIAAMLCAASGCSVDPIVTTAAVRLHLTGDCRPPGPVSEVEIRALGDFPPSGQTVAALPPQRTTSLIDRFPAGTRLLSMGVEDPWSGRAPGPGIWSAGAVRWVEMQQGRFELDALLLPLGRACSVGDPELRAPPQSSIAALPDGGLLIGGGIADGSTGEATARVVRLRSGMQVGDAVRELVLARAGAAAVATPDAVLFIGGALSTEGLAHNRYETYDLQSDTVALAETRLVVRRRDHGAVRLGDGRILIVGGVRRVGDDPLDTAEILDPADGTVRLLGDGPGDGAGDARLPAARSEPRTVKLDDGTVLIVGGRGRAGGATGSVYAFDPSSETFEGVLDAGERGASSLGIPARDQGIAVALPGRRMAWLGQDEGDERRANAITLLRRVDDYLGAPVMRRHDLVVEGIPPGLQQVRAVALADGRLLVTGRLPDEPDDSFACDRGFRRAPEVKPEPQQCAFVVDLVEQRAEQREAFSPTPGRLIRLSDGTVAALSDGGAVLRREAMRSPLDNAPATLLAAPGEAEVAFSAPGHWEPSTDGPGFVASEDGARVDVAGLRFADVEVSLDVDDGGRRVELLLLPEGAPARAVQMFDGEVAVGLCTTMRHGSTPLHITRRDDTVQIDAGGEAPKRCRVVGLSGRIGIAVRTRKGVVVRGLRIRRVGAGD